MASTQIRWFGAQVKRRVGTTVERNLDRAAQFLKSEIQKSMKKGGGKGDVSRTRTRGKRGKRKPIPRSKPGEPPFVQTGRLRQSIFARRGGRMTREVGTNLNYAVALELGTKHVAARPFIRPALAKNRREIARMIATGKRL